MRIAIPIIIGGGPAGAGAAIALARAGARPLLLERQIVTGDAICGGFLSWATLDRLDALGVDREALAGHSIARVTIYSGRTIADVALPAPALGVSRRRLDTVLLDAANRAGAEIRRGAVVRSIGADTICIADAEELPWESLFLASGKHEIRGASRSAPPADDPELGLRLRLPASAPLHALVADAIELHLFPGGYLGIMLQEDGSANCAMAVRKSRLMKAGGNPYHLFAQIADASPALADRLATLRNDAVFDAIGHVPYGWRARDTVPGVYRLGDQAAVIPSLAGEGIGIALASAAMAAQVWRAQGRDGARSYQRAFAREAARPIIFAGLAKRIATLPVISPSAIRLLTAFPSVLGMLARLTRIDP